MAFVGRRSFLSLVLCLPALLPAPPLLAQAPAPLETVPDPARVPPAEVPFVNPLWQPVDTPAAPKGAPPRLEKFRGSAALIVAARIDEAGKVSAAVAPEPPIRALGAAVGVQAPRWTFQPAKKDGQAVPCWGTYGVDVEVQLEDGRWSAFRLAPVGKDDPLPELVTELPGDSWVSRYPSEVAPPEPGVYSVEEVDFLPMPEKVPLKFDSTPLKARVQALVEVSALGSVKRVVPVGAFEPFILQWVRENAKGWAIAPATNGGAPVSSWLALDASIDYTLDWVKERGKRSIRKNVRGAPLP